jgi:hypothetical protein
LHALLFINDDDDAADDVVPLYSVLCTLKYITLILYPYRMYRYLYCQFSKIKQ